MDCPLILPTVSVNAPFPGLFKLVHQPLRAAAVESQELILEFKIVEVVCPAALVKVYIP
ncbi:hypothetical protein D3C80_1184790 [compost metagenome]